MIKNDNILAAGIELALQETIKKYENSENDSDKLLCSVLERSKVLWESIKLHNLDVYGLSYEDFCKQCEEKRNIIFLSDEEVELFNKALKIMNAIKE